MRLSLSCFLLCVLAFGAGAVAARRRLSSAGSNPMPSIPSQWVIPFLLGIPSLGVVPFLCVSFPSSLTVCVAEDMAGAVRADYNPMPVLCLRARLCRAGTF